MGVLGNLGLGSIGGGMLSLATSFFFWIAVIFFMVLVGFAALKIRQNKRYEFTALEIISLGQGKVRINKSKCGWFRSQKRLFGLLDYAGEEELLLKPRFLQKPRRIYYASSEDYHDIFGKRGIICKRKGDDPQILVPLDSFEVSNNQILAQIAPADYRDAALKIYEDKKRETLTWWDENKTIILAMSIFVFGLVALIIVFKFAAGESSAWREFATNAANNVRLPSSAP